MSSTRNRPRAPLRLDCMVPEEGEQVAMPAEEGVGLDHMEGIAPRGVQPGQEHQDKPVLSVEAWARWRRASEYEDLLAEERVLGDKRRAGPDGVDADRAHQRCPSADGPQHVLDGPATFVDASTDGRLDGPGQPVQHAGLLSHRVLGSRGRGTRFSQQRLTALRRKPLLCGWTGQVASTGQRRYSDLAIETALTLRLLYHLPLRQAEGFLHALFGMMRLDLSAPDSTRRSPGAASI